MSRDIDTHELLKREAFWSSSAASDAHFEKSRPSPYEPHGFSDQYMILDSWAKDEATSDLARGLFAWNFNVQGATTDQAAGVRGKLETVTEIQIGSFLIPNLPPAAQMANPLPGGELVPGFPLMTTGADFSGISPLSATFGWFPYVGRVTIEMREIGLQSVSQRKGVRYHFEADVYAVFNSQGSLNTALGSSIANPTNPFPNGLRVTPLDGFDTYCFTDPIQDIHGLSLQFRAVDTVLPFPADAVPGAQAFTSPALYPFLGFQLPAADNALTRRYIVQSSFVSRALVSGFTSGSAAVDGWVNQTPAAVGQLPAGAAPGLSIAFHDVTNPVNNFIPGPNIDISSLVPAAPTEKVLIPSSTPTTVRFTSARVRVPLRVRTVVARTTNYA